MRLKCLEVRGPECSNEFGYFVVLHRGLVVFGIMVGRFLDLFVVGAFGMSQIAGILVVGNFETTRITTL
jgi:hypothetical protein